METFFFLYFSDNSISVTPRIHLENSSLFSSHCPLEDVQCPTEIYVRRQKRVHFLQQSFFHRRRGVQPPEMLQSFVRAATSVRCEKGGRGGISPGDTLTWT